ncbi:MAG: OsmC family protein [Acidimicrobiales bacterium]
MTSAHYVAAAVGSTSSAAPAYRVDIRTGRHRLITDEPTAGGGGDAGPSPFGLLLSALVGCTAMTLRMYAARKDWELTMIEVSARYDVDDGGRGSIQRSITLPAALPVDQRDRLADIAERTPVTIAVRAGTPITTTVVSDTAV